jgi:hypothetical protein
VLEDSGEGNVLKSTTEKNTRSTQVQGSRKEITPPTPALLLVYIWIDAGTTMEASKLPARGGRSAVNSKTIK